MMKLPNYYTQKISSSPLSIVRRFHRFSARAIQEPSPGGNQTGVEIHKRLPFLSAVFPCRPINATDNKWSICWWETRIWKEKGLKIISYLSSYFRPKNVAVCVWGGGNRLTSRRENETHAMSLQWTASISHQNRYYSRRLCHHRDNNSQFLTGPARSVFCVCVCLAGQPSTWPSAVVKHKKINK